MTNFDQLQHILGLTLLEGVGHVLTKRLIAHCGSAEEVFKEKANLLVKVPGIGDNTARIIRRSKKALNEAAKEINYCLQHNIDVVCYYDDKYPHRLKNCEDGPAILFKKGNLDLNPKRIINIIGTRQPSDYGKDYTEELVQALIPYQATIVSGMAYGIDAVAHKSSLKYGIPTVGVVAHGLSTIYPPTHMNLANEIITNGALITEHIHSADPDKENFPKRNRIVAGMCDATIVIETDVKGGSMITAKLANDYNREVFALPGKPNDPKAKGCHLLIKSNRAALFENVNDIVQTLNWNQSSTPKSTQISLFTELEFEELAIATILKEKGRCMIDVLSYETGQAMNKVSVNLLNMEFKGAVRSLPGKLYELIA